MKSRIIKYALLSTFAFIALAFALPQTAEASGFGGLSIHAYKLTASGTWTNYEGLSVTWDSTASNAYKWERSNGTCYGCADGAFWDGSNAHGRLNLTTGSDGKAAYGTGNNVGAACGNSVCNSGDAGTCNPFTISGTGSGDFDADISGWKTYVDGGSAGTWTSGLSFSRAYDVANGSDRYYDLYFYGRRDRLDGTFSRTVVDNKLDCVQGVADEATYNAGTDSWTPTNADGAKVDFSVSTTHDAFPGHAGVQYNIDWTNNSSFGAGDTGWINIASPNQSHVYQSAELVGGVPAATGKVVTARVDFRCNDGHNPHREVSKYVNFTLFPAQHSLVCKSLTVNPNTGYIPLSTRLTAIAEDNHSCNASGITYNWKFGDEIPGEVKPPVTTTFPVNFIDYTYVSEGNFVPRVSVSKGSLPTTYCPAKASVRSQKWSESNYQEIAP